MKFLHAHKFTKNLLLALAIGFVFVVPVITHAQATGTVSKYAQQLTCPSNISTQTTPTACTYQDGTATTCTDSDGDYTCNNPDNSVTTCILSQGAATEAGASVSYTCSVKNADGSSGGSITTSVLSGVVNQTPTSSTGQQGPTTTSVPAVGVIGHVVSGFLTNVVTGAVAGVALMILIFAGNLLGIFGIFFNWIITVTVFHFGSYFGNTAGLIIAWGVLRDVGNILLLFGFVYIGVMMILDLHSFDARKALPRLIIFAILLNFSLFAAEAVIDTSNVLTANLFNQAGQSSTACSSTDTSTCVGSGNGIADQIVNAAGIGNLFKSNNLQNAISKIQSDAPHAMVVYIGLAIFVSITAVVLLAGAIMLAIRAIILTFIMVAAPIGFAAMAIPQFERFAKQWWSMLLSQAFYAPVFLLLIYVGLKVMSGITTAINPQNSSLLDALNTPGTGFGTVFIVFGLVIGFMIAALMSAKSLGGMGASFATNTAARVTYGTLTRATNGVVGGAGRLGRYGIQNSALGNTAAGKFIVNNGFRRLENANLDLRKIGVGAALKAAGATDGANAASHASYADMSHIPHQITETFRAGDKKYNDEMKNKSLEDEAHHLKDTENLSAANQKYLSSLGVKQLETLHGIQEGVAGMARNLSPQQFEDLMKSDKLSDTAKEKLRNNRYKPTNNLVEAAIAADLDLKNKQALSTAPGATAAQIAATAAAKVVADDANTAARKAVQGLTEKDFDQLAQSTENGELFGNEKFAALLTDEQFDKAKNNQRIISTQRDLLKDTRGARYSPANVKSTVGKMSGEDISKLPKDVLKMQDPATGTFQVIDAMSGKQIGLLDPAKMDRDTVNAINTTKFNNFANAQATLSTMSAEAVAKLSATILNQQHVIQAMSAEQLSGIRPDTLDPTTLTAIQTYLRGPSNPTIDRFYTIVGVPPTPLTPGREGTNPGAAYNWKGKT